MIRRTAKRLTFLCRWPASFIPLLFILFAGLIFALFGADFLHAADPLYFRPVERHYLVATGEAVSVGDLNGDGRDDIVVSTGAKQLFPSQPDFEHQLFLYFQNGSGRLEWPDRLPAGNGKVVVMSDLNRDGRKDLIYSALNGFGVYYRNSSNSFNPEVVYSYPRSLAMDLVGIRVTDLNRDGRPDLICLYQETGVFEPGLMTYSVETVLQGADGNFGPSTVVHSFRSAAPVLAVDSGDFNRDGMVDMVVMNTRGEDQRNGFLVLPQTSDGTFGAPIYYSSPEAATDVRAMAVGDLNGDGLSDVVVAKGFSIEIYTQSPTGLFSQPPVVYSSYTYPKTLRIADMNNDGRADVVVLHLGATEAMGMYLQSPDGTLQAEQLYATVFSSYNAHAMDLGDVNGDGSKDVVYADFEGFSIAHSTGTGPRLASQSLLDFGTVALASPSSRQIPLYNTGVTDLTIRSAGIGGPQAPEFPIISDQCSGRAVSPRESCMIEVDFLSSSEGARTATLTIESNDPVRPGKVIDIKAKASQTVNPLPSIGHGQRRYFFGRSPAQAVAVGDVNSDGRPDIVVTTGWIGDAEHDNRLYVFLQDGSGELGPPVSYPAANSSSIAIEDFNSDGRKDVAIAVKGGFAIFYQNGSGQLEPMRLYGTEYENVFRVRAADFNGDNLQDIVVLASAPGWDFWEIAIFIQNGQHGFDRLPRYMTPYRMGAFQLADINGDGRTDLISFDGNYIRTYLQDRAGRLEMPRFRFHEGVPGGGLAVGDVNSDSLPDIVTANTYYGNPGINVELRNKEGELDPLTWFYSTMLWEPKNVTLGDVNGDGRPDVIVLQDGWCAVQVWLQNSDGSLAVPPVTIDTPLFSPEFEALAAGDVDGDGAAEIIYVAGAALTVLYPKDHAPRISISPSSVDFGTVTIGESSASATITMTNTGNADLAIESFSFSDSEFIMDRNNCSNQILLPTARCTIEIRFTPRMATEGRRMYFTVRSNDPANASATIYLSGKGVQPGPPAPSISLGTPSDGNVFTTCSLETSGQPTFTWTGTGGFSSYTVLFSLHSSFTPSLGKGLLSGTSTSWSPSKSLWTSMIKSSRGQSIYWKVTGIRTDKTTVQSEVRIFRLGDAAAPSLTAPSEGGILSSPAPFAFATGCNVRFRLEFSSLSDFSKSSKVRYYTPTSPRPGQVTQVEGVVPKALWNQIRKIVGMGSGYVRVRAWDRLNRETVSEAHAFTIQ